MSDLFEQIATLSPQKRELFKAFLSESGSEFNSFPLSFAQQRLWFLDQFEPGSPLYNIPAAVHIKGVLDVVALEKSINAILQRHEALRTTFVAVGGYPVQVIAPALTIKLPLVALEDLGRTERKITVQWLATEAAQQVFDLTRGPLLRAKLLRLADDEYVLILIWHHIVADGWSLGVFMCELTALYGTFAANMPLQLPHLPIQYADYAVWQREWLRDEVLEEQLAYWRGQLGGELPVLQLPTDRPRPAVQTFRGARQAVALSKPLTAALLVLSQQEGVTLFMTLLAAFKTLLYRYTGQNDVLVGSPIANRSTRETENLIGFFVNTLVLRTDLSGNPTFRELLQRVREVALGAYAHQDMPFEKLVEDLQPGRDMSHAPLFQVMFALQNAPMSPVELPGLSLSLIEVDSGTAKFDLILDFAETAEGLRGWFEYNSDLFEAETIARMARHLQTLLESVVTNSDQRLASLPLLTAAEHSQLLVEWNATKVEYPQDRCIHQLFEAQVEASPEAIAVIWGTQQLTYQHLNWRANQLAFYLRKLGVGPEVRVGVCLGRSLEMLVGLLGVLKAGGAYVPLDLTYPSRRLAFICKDAQMSILLTQAELIARLGAQTAQLVYLDGDWESDVDRDAGGPISQVTADNLAYLIYTSGSTGRPKGVAIEHRSATAMLNWSRERFSHEDRVGVLASTSICFDLSVFELFVPLCWGGRIILAENALSLPTLPAAQDVTLINTVPSAMTELARMGSFPSSVRTVNLAGEPLPRRLVDQVYQHDHVERVFNLYGPSEDTTYSTFALIERQSQQIPPIGRPIANSQVYLLDPQGAPAPMGVPGELYIGGDGLARGYLSQPDLTAERFVPDPFGNEAGARLYRTGDLARYRPDGELEFLGRIDHQVKMRGFRIELGEVETVLRQHPAIEETVVIVWGEVPGEQRLVAYLVGQRQLVSDDGRVTDSTSLPTVSELRDFLKARLPDYMVPSVFVSLTTLPLTPNGKVDRRALPAPDATRPELEGVFVAPRTPVEELLATQWAEVLGVERVGIYDNFFELGGHSLLATHLIAHLREIFQIELPVRSLFEAASVFELAQWIESTCQTAPRRQAPPIHAVSRDADLPLSFAQQRLWFLDQFEGQTAVYNVAGAVRLIGQLDVIALERSLNAVVCRHEILRTTFVQTGEQPVQVIAPVLHLTLPVLDLRQLPQTERERTAQQLAADEARYPFDLERGPLVRVKLLHLTDQEAMLLLSLHHIVTDGWSMGVLVREVAAFYNAFTLGATISLPALSIQYADVAAWQRDWLQGERLEEQLAYWREQLDGDLPPLELPADHPRPSVQTFQGATQELLIPWDLTEELRALSRREGVTLFMTLLAAFKTLLHRYTGQDNILVGSPIANRSAVGTENLIGFFVNTLVLRTDFLGNPTFRELLHRVREIALEAYAHQDIPFEKLVQELQPERDMSRAPLFQVMFVLQNVPMPIVELPGLSLTTREIDSGTAKFDLTLNLEETSESLRGWFKYNTDLFEMTTIARMAQHLQTLLKGIVTDCNRRLADLPILTQSEQQQLLVAWNATSTDWPQDKCVHELFETQVTQTPDTVAAVFKDEFFTYRELNRRANQLAHYLRGCGVEPDVLVGVCLEHSGEMLVGLLGILKSGGAYVPLDPEYPPERLEFMLKDAQIQIVLSQGHLAAHLSTQRVTGNSEANIHVICLDTDGASIAQACEENLDSGGKPGNLAYVIYTSGSTGQPKGVSGTHHSLLNYLQWFNRAMCDGFIDCLPVTTKLTFDAALKQLFAPLLVGREVWILENDIATWPNELLQELSARPRVGLNCVPSLWKTILDIVDVSHQQAPPAHITHLLVGGEVLDWNTVDRSLTLFPNLHLWNLYGPTEATVNASVARITRGDKITIGHPIDNVQLYILDKYWQPVPVGVVGELYIGGEGLVRGYLHRPGLTAERFIPNPFSEKLGARLYQTGDLARYLPDGAVEFRGRGDYQVKVRGHRIELGEIEVVLRQHPAVQEAVVLVREDEFGKEWLLAYVVTRPGQPFMVVELRSFLQEKLPNYMLPSAFVRLEALPLMPNGKVDRCALPAPDAIRPGLKRSFVAPRTPTEEILARIWTQVLGIGQLGVYDDFFELGGHSLSAIQVVSRIQQLFHVKVPVRSLFETPTIADLATSVEVVRRTKEHPQAPPMLLTKRDADLDLSFAQQRLWFLNQLEPDSPFYNMPAAIRLTGRLSVPALEHGLNRVIQRHETLRTTFGMANGRPVQVIAPFSVKTLSLVDLQNLPESERETEAWNLAIQDARRPFDLTQGPLLRVALLRLSKEAHLLLVNFHHIVSDGWSIGVFIQELATLYQACVDGKSAFLPELPIQYVDFAHWQRRWLQEGVLETLLSYWRQQLADSSLVLELPTDGPRPAMQTFQGVTHTFDLPESLLAAVEVLTQQAGTTLFMTLLAAFQTLLYRYTGQVDIIVGTPIANRNRTEIEGLIGFFVNMLVLRTDLSNNPTFLELLSQVREVTLDAYANSDLPFEKLVEELQPQRDPSRSPLFQVMFVFQNTLRKEVNLLELNFSIMPIERGTAQFDLSLYLFERPEGWGGMLEYNTNLFKKETVEQLAAHYQILLEGVVANPDQPVANLPLLTKAEQIQLVEWNKTETEYSRSRCLHHLIEAQVERTPEAVAVVCEREHLTYQALNRRANQLGYHLQELGGGSGALVGVFMERSLEMVIGIVGVLKAGGAYVPLDPEYPQERLAFMVQDAQVSVLLTQERLLNRLSKQVQRVICLDSGWAAVAQKDEENLGDSVTADTLAYVIYTSGSTGRPKGVQIQHSGVVNFLETMRQRPGLTDRDCLLAVTTLCFDIAVLELFLPLITGARIVLVSRKVAGDGVLLRDMLNTVRPTVLQATPATWWSLVEAEWGGNKAIKMLCGGEPLPEDLARRLLKKSDSLWNLYGPTEATVWATICRVGCTDRLASIGQPIANMQTYVLDRYLQPVPVGVLGELYIGGVGLAQGYLNRPALTAERFVPNPFCNEPGERLYRTGDVVRYLSDGNIEFLGRADHQIKIRGFRIELGEIEAMLSRHPAVRETVVIAPTVRKDMPGDKRLVAYVVPNQGTAVNASELGSFLKEKLPNYMIPSAFVVLDMLPLTPNGKMDRQALPIPDWGGAKGKDGFVEPRTPIEEELANIWAQVLDIERVGVYDDFFELGGHSLLAVRIISQIRETFQIEIPLLGLFEEPTVANLASKVTQNEGRRVDAHISALKSRHDEAIQTLENLVALSDAEVDALLDDLLLMQGDDE